MRLAGEVRQLAGGSGRRGDHRRMWPGESSGWLVATSRGSPGSSARLKGESWNVNQLPSHSEISHASGRDAALSTTR
jgi:hypothetical protein